MGRGFTPSEREWIISHYKQLGPTRIAEKMGKHPNTLKKYAKSMRVSLRRAGDERWRNLDATGVVRRKAKLKMLEADPREEIKYYGKWDAPSPIEGKYGICPPWLVVTFPAYQRALIDFPSGGKPGHGGSWMSDKQCSGRDVGAVHQVSMVEVVGHRVGD